MLQEMHSTILITCIKQYSVLKTFVLSIFERPLKTCFTVCFFLYLDCSPLASPANANLDTDSVVYNTAVTLSCVDGYTSFGPTTTNCQDGGVWSNELAECKKGMGYVTLQYLNQLKIIIEPQTRDFQQYGIFASLDSDRPLQPPLKLRYYK